MCVMNVLTRLQHIFLNLNFEYKKNIVIFIYSIQNYSKYNTTMQNIIKFLESKFTKHNDRIEELTENIEGLTENIEGLTENIEEVTESETEYIKLSFSNIDGGAEEVSKIKSICTSSNVNYVGKVKV